MELADTVAYNHGIDLQQIPQLTGILSTPGRQLAFGHWLAGKVESGTPIGQAELLSTLDGIRTSVDPDLAVPLSPGTPSVPAAEVPNSGPETKAAAVPAPVPQDPVPFEQRTPMPPPGSSAPSPAEIANQYDVPSADPVFSKPAKDEVIPPVPRPLPPAAANPEAAKFQPGAMVQFKNNRIRNTLSPDRTMKGTVVSVHDRKDGTAYQVEYGYRGRTIRQIVRESDLNPYVSALAPTPSPVSTPPAPVSIDQAMSVPVKPSVPAAAPVPAASDGYAPGDAVGVKIGFKNALRDANGNVRAEVVSSDIGKSGVRYYTLRYTKRDGTEAIMREIPAFSVQDFASGVPDAPAPDPSPAPAPVSIDQAMGTPVSSPVSSDPMAAAMGEPVAAPVESPSAIDQAMSNSPRRKTTAPVVQDFGEKIGGARKDLAVKPARREKTAEEIALEALPGWRRKYTVEQSRYSSGEDAGKWIIWDNSKKYGRIGRGSFNTKEEAEAAIPLAEVSRNHRVSESKNGSGYTIYRLTGSGSGIFSKHLVPVMDGFATRAEAMAYLAKHPVEIIEHKFQEPSKPVLDRIERTGESRRQGDATPQMFQEAFGFRGGEFGNWNQGRNGQDALNHAYDGLHDLAAVIGVPSQALSLNGKLAIAFGARGHGGKNAALAHYEPGKVVINLTKMAGAGSLAHEWGHSIDHYLGNQNQNGIGNEWTAPANPALKSKVPYLSEYNAKKIRPELYSAWTGIERAISEKPGGGRSDYMRRSMEIDRTRSKPYWSTRVELFARAFESYVQDKIEQDGNKRQYLVHGTAGAPYPSGVERQAINDAFDRFFQELKTEERDGRTIMYRHATGDQVLGTPDQRVEYLRQAMPWAQIDHQTGETSALVTLPSGQEVRISLVDEVRDEQGRLAEGSVQVIDKTAIVTLGGIASQWTADHETWHLAKESADLSPRELRALENDYHGDEEAESEAHAKFMAEERAPRTLSEQAFKKIGDLFRSIAEAFGWADSKTAFRRVASGKAFETSKTVRESSGPRYRLAETPADTASPDGQSREIQDPSPAQEKQTMAERTRSLRRRADDLRRKMWTMVVQRKLQKDVGASLARIVRATAGDDASAIRQLSDWADLLGEVEARKIRRDAVSELESAISRARRKMSKMDERGRSVVSDLLSMTQKSENSDDTALRLEIMGMVVSQAGVDMTQAIQKQMSKLDRIPVSKLSTSEIMDYAREIEDATDAGVKRQKEFVEGRFEAWLAKYWIPVMNSLKDQGADRRINWTGADTLSTMQKFWKGFRAAVLTPESIAFLLDGKDDGPVKAVLNTLRSAHNDFLRVEHAAADILRRYNPSMDKDLEEIRGSTQVATGDPERYDSGIRSPDGQPLMFTKAERMSLYNAGRDPDNLKRMVSGIPVGTNPDKSFRYSKPAGFVRHSDRNDATGSKPMVLTLDQYQQVVSQLTPAEKRVADAMFSYLNNEGKKIINDMSMRIIGVNLATVASYWPIVATEWRADLLNNEELSKKLSLVDANGRMPSLEDRGPLKDRLFNASSPVVLMDALISFDRVRRVGSAYGTMADAVRNYRQLVDGSEFGPMADSILPGSSEIMKKLGNDFQNGGAWRRPGGLDSLAGKLISNMQRSVLLAKPFTLIKQPISYALMLNEFSMDDMLAGLAAMKKAWPGPERKRLLNDLKEYAPDLYERYSGAVFSPEAAAVAGAGSAGRFFYGANARFGDLNILRGVDRSSAGAKRLYSNVGNAARATTSAFTDLMAQSDFLSVIGAWSAAQSEISKANPRMDRNSPEFKRLVAARAGDVVQKTQSTSDVVSNSEWGRDRGPMMRLVLAFSNQLNKMFNMLARETMRFHRSAKAPADYQRLARAYSVVIILGAGVEAAINGLRNSIGEDDKDRKRKRLQRFDPANMGLALGEGAMQTVYFGGLPAGISEAWRKGRPLQAPSTLPGDTLNRGYRIASTLVREVTDDNRKMTPKQDRYQQALQEARMKKAWRDAAIIASRITGTPFEGFISTGGMAGDLLFGGGSGTPSGKNSH